MVAIRKALAGSDSHGHAWPHDGAVTDVEPEHVTALLHIPDGGFSLAAELPGEPDPEPEEEPEPEPVTELTEPAPPPETPVSEAPKPRTRKPRAGTAG